VFCLHNVSSKVQRISVASINLVVTEDWFDLISGEALDPEVMEIELSPCQCYWLMNRKKHLPY
jgi:sucrose phosphorylase|tara:strand:+ start:596 stop:784 length:189 start_codon:yes stop_codon:yes gene_type:complete